MRYQLHQHPAFPEPLSREDLYILVQRGSLARGDLCHDVQTGRDHLVGEIVNGMRPPRAPGLTSRVERPAYQEIRGDSIFSDEPAIDPEFSDPAIGRDDDPDADGDVATGEEILHFSHPSWLAYAKALFLCLLLGIVAALLLTLDSPYFLLAAVFSVALLCGIAIARFSQDYIVTEDRVEIIWGILGRSSKEVRICDIRSIDVHQKGLPGFLGLGTVDFSSAANAGVEVQFRNTRSAHRIKELVRQLQRTSR